MNKGWWFLLFALGLVSTSPAQTATKHTSATVPSLCQSCVFYGGDYNPTDPNHYAFANENTVLVPNAATYAAVTIPQSSHGVISGILFVELLYHWFESAQYFDPATATYDIRTGLSEFYGGTRVASGSGTLSFAPYKDCCEQVAVNLTLPLAVTPGTTYWFNMLPQCTDPHNPVCVNEDFYLVNTTQQTNGLNPEIQPTGDLFFNCSFFAVQWTNWCIDMGLNAQQCARASFGLMGSK